MARTPVDTVPVEQTIFEIGTGTVSGTYFPVGEMLAAVVSHPAGSVICAMDRPCGPEGLIAIAQTSDGSIMNVRDVDAQVIESALAQADITSWATNSEEIFANAEPKTNLRVIANLYPESIHLVTRRGAGIRSVAGLRGKRVSVGAPQSGTIVNAQITLEAYGIKKSELQLIEAGSTIAADLILRGELDAFFFVGGAPLRSVQHLARQGAIDLIDISETAPTKRLLKRYKYFRHDVIPAGTYDGIGEVTTLSVGALWIVHKDVPERRVYEITRALWGLKNRSLLEQSHEKGALLSIERAVTGVPIEFHPGAARFYREIGILSD